MALLSSITMWRFVIYIEKEYQEIFWGILFVFSIISIFSFWKRKEVGFIWDSFLEGKHKKKK